MDIMQETLLDLLKILKNTLMRPVLLDLALVIYRQFIKMVEVAMFKIFKGIT